jgi:hypothetical protein
VNNHRKAAAQQLQVPEPVAANLISVVELARKMRTRSATILINLPDRTTSESGKTSPQVRIPLDGLIVITSHRLVRVDNRFSCSVCLINFNIKDASLKPWSQTACHTESQPPHLCKPTRCAGNTHFANQMSHTSHVFTTITEYCTVINVEPDLVQIRLGNLPDSVRQSRSLAK